MTKNNIVFEGHASAWEVRKRVWRIAWPSIGEQCLNLLVGLADVFFVGHITSQAAGLLGYSSADALSAVALGTFYINVVLVTLSGLAVAATALVARALGAGQRVAAKNIGRQAMVLALGLGVIVAAIIHTFAVPLIQFFGANNQLAGLGATYLQTASLGMPMLAMMVVGNAVLRGSGDTRTPLLVVLLVNFVNIGCGSIFVNGAFGISPLGVAGSAIGPAVGWSLGGLLITLRLLGVFGKGNPDRNIYISTGFKLERAVLSSLSNIGLPSWGEQMVFQIGFLFFSRFIIGLGETVYAAHVAVITADGIAILPGVGFAVATTVLVGQCLGANRPDLAERYSLTALQMGLVFVTIVGLVSVLFPQFFIGLLVNDPRVVEAAANPMRIAGLTDIFIGTITILMGALRGAGDAQFGLYARIGTTWMVRIFAAWLFINVLGLGLVGGRLAIMADLVLLTGLIIWRFRTGRWKTMLTERERRIAARTGPATTATTASPAIEE